MHICLLDIDGTLVLTGGAGQTAFAQTLAADFGIAEINTKVAFAGRSDRAIVADLFRDHGVAPSDENWQRFRGGYLSRLDSALKSHQGRVLPGVARLLEALAARGDVAIGLVTGNIHEGARRKLTHFGLWHWFPFGGFGDEHVERDHIAAAALAAARLHLEPTATAGRTNGQIPVEGQIIVIGDTEHDIRCGRSIGARCVAVATGHSTIDQLQMLEPDLVLSTLEEADAVLRLLD
jgi:phosphoglycolate phosphatase